MLFLLRFLPVFADTLSVVLALPLSPSNTTPHSPTSSCTEASNTPVPPSDDCFYRPPVCWESKKPGTVLNFRSALGNPIANYSRVAYNILYRTTDSNDKPTYAVTTAFVPIHITKPHALVSYQHNYNSADVNDSPSFKIYNDEIDISRVNPDLKEILGLPDKISPIKTFVSGYLDRGWFVNLPDFEGPLAAFGAGRMAGYATLDSIRATLSIIYAIGMPRPMLDDPAHPKLAMYGYSGGSFATEWAAELQFPYAPELKFAGAGVGGVFPNATDTFLKLGDLQGTAYGGDLRSAVVGIATMHEAAQRVVTNLLRASDWTDARHQLLNGAYVNVTELLNNTTVRQIFERDVSLGLHGLPRMPLLIHRNDADILSTTADSIELQDHYCDDTATVYLHISPEKPPFGDPHYWEGIEASGLLKVLFNPVLSLLDEMFKGTFPKECKRVTAAWGKGIYE